jgi:hypothetical protein
MIFTGLAPSSRALAAANSSSNSGDAATGTGVGLVPVICGSSVDDALLETAMIHQPWTINSRWF